ncbi:MAG: hypothetical protein JW993_02595 [Sedimentisphaerales bacterium]|nr:hypothetical protein [Sedimentisphaerales bacterium]
MLRMDAKARALKVQRRFLGMRWPVAVCLLVVGATLAAEATAEPADTLWDPQRYISVEEVKPGMEAYCLTDYGVDGVEKFALRVVNVVYEIEPGRDAILVMGLDERFKHTGVVAGCSGSPVYIDGRLAGALAFGWTYSKDPLYGVTPIKEMLQVGSVAGSDQPAAGSRGPAFSFDFSKPIDLVAVSARVKSTKLFNIGSTGAATRLPCPLLISGLSPASCEQAASQLEAMGFAAAPGLSGSAEGESNGSPEFTPGAALTIPLVAGDIKMYVLGTVTEVRGDRVYGFGHSFLGYGPLNLPMAGGKVYTVVSSVMRSSKLGAATDIVGSITSDETAAIYGKIGMTPRMIPLSIRVNHFNDSTVRTYHCQVADNESLAPQLVPSAVSAAALQVGSLPPDHTVEYKAAIDLKDGNAVRFANISTGVELSEPISELMGALVLLMNNPFKTAEIESLDFDVRISPKNTEAHLWSVDVSNTTVKPGEDIEVTVVVESYLAEKKMYRLTLTVPEDVAAGKYQLLLCGVYEYENFLRKTTPYRFLATNYRTLIEALNDALSVERTKLHCCLVLPPEGIMLEKAQLPSLPETKAVIFQNDGRALKAQPHPRWIEKTVETGTVIADKEIVPIVVEEK